ncbi:MAG: pyruvate:ferredoxin (flavodoxin) oxidoreductase [Deltaproteobacteria bacterium]|nr:pyruvate:ferredoxin (flavodoxin) oxidoreductase [Deltaproteobacteria bacterium]
MVRKMVPHSGNSAVTHVAHAVNEVIAIYPITPSSDMGEIADEKSARGEKNIWGTTPIVTEMQSEGGAAGACHGALTTGALTTTFTASQGLLLMIPDMFKIAGEHCSAVFHVSARAIATHALSIFGDHSDVMSARSTGWGFLSSASIQEAMDFALISQAASLESRIPFIHFFEGFRISHEIQKVEELTFDDMRHMINDDLVHAHRARGLNPDKPSIRGTSQNPDVFFTCREAGNKYYAACADIVQKNMDKFAKLTGRQYKLYDYYGAPDADRVIIIMGCGGETAQETMKFLNNKGEKLGVLQVRLYRPFDVKSFAKALPKSVKAIAVLDRTKEPGAIGDPLYGDVRTAIGEAMQEGWFDHYPKIVGSRYGLGSAEFTPAMVKAVYDNLTLDKPKNHCAVGPKDDVMGLSLDYDPSFTTEDKIYQAMFFGLGADGTVGANKNSIKIIGEETDNYAQGYFVYDSKKAGAITVSHLRFGKDLIQKPYLVDTADFIACHNFSFLEKYDVLRQVKEGGTFLLTSMYNKDEVWSKLPGVVQKEMIDKKLKFYVIDAIKIAEDLGLGARINIVMQTAFFKISQVIDEKVAIDAIKNAVKKTYGKKGDKIVDMNNAAVDKALECIEQVQIPNDINGGAMPPTVPEHAPEFVKNTTAKLMRGEGECVTVSEVPDDGTWPVSTTQYEKRNIAVNIPVWNPESCVQCGKCVMVCPHAAIRSKIYPESLLKDAPETFKHAAPKLAKGLDGHVYTLQVAPEDCTGCETCVENCPAKAKEAIKMQPQPPLRENERKNYEYFLNKIPDPNPELFNRNTMNGIQYVKPLFEYSGACAGCGETAYVKLLSQLFGDRAIIANATGCSSIYGGNLPTTPYCQREDGRGPVWTNSLFEDNAEVAYGMRVAVDKHTEYANELADKVLAGNACTPEIKGLLTDIKGADQSTQQAIDKQHVRIDELKPLLKKCGCTECKELETVAGYLVKKSVWALGGDGWAYDIGYGGLDHVLATGKNVNILVMDTEVYSNTGGQASKATPMGAVAKFAAGGKAVNKKDLGLISTTYGYIYVAAVALGADPMQTMKAFIEAESYDGPSIVIAYSHCIAHGINMTKGLEEQKKAVNSGHFPLYRYNPTALTEGKNPLTVDSKEPTVSIEEYISGENRYRILMKARPEVAKQMAEQAQKHAKYKYNLYKYLSEMKCE